MSAGSVMQLLEKIFTLGRFPRQRGALFQPSAITPPFLPAGTTQGANGPNYPGVGIAVGHGPGGGSTDLYGMPASPPPEGEQVTVQQGPHAGSKAFNGYDSEGNHIFRRDDGSGWWFDKKEGKLHTFQSESTLTPLKEGDETPAAPARKPPALPGEDDGFITKDAYGNQMFVARPKTSGSDYTGGVTAQPIQNYTPGSVAVRPIPLAVPDENGTVTAGDLMVTGRAGARQVSPSIDPRITWESMQRRLQTGQMVNTPEGTYVPVPNQTGDPRVGAAVLVPPGQQMMAQPQQTPFVRSAFIPMMQDEEQ